MRLNYNVGGICLSEAAFRKLQQEISLSPWAADPSEPGFSGPWVDEQREFFVGTVPIANGVFRKIAIRKNRIAQVDVRDLSICTGPTAAITKSAPIPPCTPPCREKNPLLLEIRISTRS